MRTNKRGKRSAANVSVTARRCPVCRNNDALRVRQLENKVSETWCRFCTFTETRGRHAT